MDAAQKIRDWIKQTAADAGISPAAWAKKAGVAPSTVQRAIKDDYAFVTSSRTLEKLAVALGVEPPAVAGLASARDVRQAPTFLPIRYEVGAGLWRAVEEVQEFYGSAPVLADPAFAGFPQWLERVVTDSMDREYPIGSLLHVVDAIAIGYAPRTGDHVIIERTRNSGGDRERTVKEVVVKPGSIELWPRSTNPRWTEPVIFKGDRDQEHHIVEIRALVLGSYRSRR